MKINKTHITIVFLCISILILAIAGMYILSDVVLITSTDKQIYHSREIVKLNVTILSPVTIENATLDIVGIFVSGKPKISDTRFISLKSGYNEFLMEFQLPSCNVCGGIQAGNYSINTILYTKDPLVSSVRVDFHKVQMRIEQ